MQLVKIKYRVFLDAQGVPMYWVFLPVQFSMLAPNALRTKRIECVVDSGATRCLFHADIASFLGIDLRSGRLEMTNGIGGTEETWIHDVMLHIPGGPVKISAGFKENLPVAGLLGMKGFFEHFRITFDSVAKECTLERIYYV